MQESLAISMPRCRPTRWVRGGPGPRWRPAAVAGKAKRSPPTPAPAPRRRLQCLSEVLQQNARIDDPHAAARQESSRRVRGGPDPLTPEEVLRYGGRRYAIGAGAIGHIPAITFGRNRYSLPVPAAAGGLAAAPRQLSPEAVETARRIQSSGIRALVYGSLLAAISVAAAGTYAARALDIRSGADFQARAQALSLPLADRLRARVLPLKAAAQAWLGGFRDPGAGDNAGSSNTAEFQRRLSERWNPPRE